MPGPTELNLNPPKALAKAPGDQRRVGGRFGYYRVAGGERRRHAAARNGQRKIPRGDDDAAAPFCADARHGGDIVRSGAIEATKVDRFRNLSVSFAEQLAGLGEHGAQEVAALVRQFAGHARQRLGALGD